jgi:hypothetical protein
MSTAVKKAKVQTSIAIVASFDGYSPSDYKIAMVRTVGSGDTQMTEVAGSKAGTICIPAQYLREMFETSGQKVIEVNTENGNEQN